MFPLDREEFFRIQDLQNITLRRGMHRKLLIVALALTVVGIGVLSDHLIVGLVIIAIGLMAVPISFIIDPCIENLVLDFYRKETVHSWLSLTTSFFFLARPGSSISRELVLTTTECLDMMKTLTLESQKHYLQGN